MIGFRDIHSGKPSSSTVFQALLVVAEALDQQRYTYWYRGSYHFELGLDGWTIAVTPESADRFRLESCVFGSPRASLWCFAEDRDRLAGLVTEMAREVRALSATT